MRTLSGHCFVYLSYCLQMPISTSPGYQSEPTRSGFRSEFSVVHRIREVCRGGYKPSAHSKKLQLPPGKNPLAAAVMWSLWHHCYHSHRATSLKAEWSTFTFPDRSQVANQPGNHWCIGFQVKSSFHIMQCVRCSSLLDVSDSAPQISGM